MSNRLLPAALFTAAALAAPLRAAQVEHYAAPSADQVRAQVMQWVTEQRVTDKTLLEPIENIWADAGQLAARPLFDRVVETFVLVDDDTRRFVEACDLIKRPLLVPNIQPILVESNEFYTSVMRQYFARYLAQRRMYDEALAQFAELDPSGSIDPASYFYFKAVAEHQLLKKNDGLATIGTLLGKVEQVPVRYETLAALMQHELTALKPDTLDEVAHKMRNVERELELARAGQRVQKTEDEIIATLDAIIEKLEQQGGT